MWTVLTWIFYPTFSAKYNYLGTAVAALLVGLSSFFVWSKANKLFQIDILSIIKKPLLASLLMISILIFINQIGFSLLIIKIIIKIVVGFTTYLIFHLLFSKPELAWISSQIKCLLPKK